LLAAVLTVLTVLLVFFIFFFPEMTIKPRHCAVTGDVAQPLDLADCKASAYIQTLVDGKQVKALPLNALVRLSEPVSEIFSVLLAGSDGLMARLQGDELTDCLVINNGGQWDMQASSHPVNANIKDLSQIVVIDESADLQTGVNIISQTANLYHMTAGGMMLQSLTRYPHLDGETRQVGANSVRLYMQKLLLALQDTVQDPIQNILVMSRSGDCQYFTEPGYLELNQNKINFLDADKNKTIRDIAGIIINPPSQSIMDTFGDCLHYLEKDQPVLLIYLDGLGYHQYEEALRQGLIPNLSGCGEALRINSVWQPVTNAGFAAMVTGQSPLINGIIDRSQREPAVLTIFDRIGPGKTHALVESDVGILKLNTKTYYNTDDNSDGRTDDEVFARTMTLQQTDLDFLMVHFHGIDDAGHDYGDLDNRTLDVLARIDRYIGLIIAAWPGKVIITADHGMHSMEEGGDHGDFRYEDLMVPYLVF